MPITDSIAHPKYLVPGEDHLALLSQLQGPTWWVVPGKDRSRRRVIVTLMHGNEPSGLKAIHKILNSEEQPATDLGILFVSVEAAKTKPLLSHRYLPGQEDMNRCFAPPYDKAQGKLAEDILDLITDFAPEAVVDTHNTSGHSTIFCVTTSRKRSCEQLGALFSSHLVRIEQRLGTLMESVPTNIPTITVEFGGFVDPRADQLAAQKLTQYAQQTDLFGQSPKLNLLEKPLRLEAESNLKLTYASSIDSNNDLTVINSIDQLNFQPLKAGTVLGWYESQQLAKFTVIDTNGNNQFQDYFSLSEGIFSTRKSMTLFMATTDPRVATTDCLFYFTAEPEQRQ